MLFSSARASVCAFHYSAGPQTGRAFVCRNLGGREVHLPGERIPDKVELNCEINFASGCVIARAWKARRLPNGSHRRRSAGCRTQKKGALEIVAGVLFSRKAARTCFQ